MSIVHGQRFGNWWIDMESVPTMPIVCYEDPNTPKCAGHGYYIETDRILAAYIRKTVVDSIDEWVYHLRMKTWCSEMDASDLRQALEVCLSWLLEQRRQNKDYTGSEHIYFVRDENFVKIGFSRVSAADRIKSFETGNPRPIELLGVIPGTRKDEGELHKKFAHLRVRGEWFRAEYELLNFIAAKVKE